MPNCELRRCALKGCRNEFRPKREAQVYCKTACRNAAHKRPKKRRLALERVDIPRSVAKGPFSARKSVRCKAPHLLEIGASVTAQILAQKNQPNPISFTTPDGVKGRRWLGVGAQCVKGKWQGGSERIIGNDLHWGMTVKKAFEVDQSAIQRERRKWPVDLMGSNRQGKIDPRGLRQAILDIERILLLERESAAPTVQGHHWPLEYYEDGYPKLPACLDRRPIFDGYRLALDLCGRP